MIVGRDAYLRELRAAATSARNGRGGLSLLAGEAGIGKSRLANELFDRLRAEGFTTAWSSGHKDAAGSPYWPWSRLLGQLGEPGVVSVERTESDPTLARFLLAQSVSNVVLAASVRRPVLLVLDDLHWMDEGSLWLLGAVRAEAARAPVLLLATYRDTEPGSERMVELLGPDRNLVLGGLTPEALGEAVLELTGEQLPPRLVADLCRRTGGNPYFTAEIVRLLRAEGRLDAESLTAELPLPPTVRLVLQRRIARLPTLARRVLEVAALADEPLEVALLSEALPTPADAVTAELQRAAEARLLIATDHGHRFAHPLVRETLATDLPLDQRLRWHQRLGQQLAARFEAGAASAGETAKHLVAAAQLGGPAEEAVHYAQLAAGEAVRRTAYEDAMAFAEAALRVLPPSAPGRGPALCVLGEAALAAGRKVRAREVFSLAAELARRVDDAKLLGAAALGMTGGASGFEVSATDAEAAETLQQAIEANRAAGDSALNVALLARNSLVTRFVLPLAERRRLVESAVAMARRLDQPRELAVALAAQCDVLAGPDQVRTRIAAARELLATAASSTDRALRLLGHRLLFVALAEIGDWAGVDRELDAFTVLAQELRQPGYTWYAPLWRSFRAQMRGDYEEAHTQLTEVERLAKQSGSINAAILAAVGNALLLVHENEPDQAYQVLLDGQLVDPTMLATPALAFMRARAGRTVEAYQALEALPRNDLGLPFDSEWLPSMAMAADAAVLTGHRRMAELVYRELAPYADLFAIEGIAAGTWGSVAAHLGRLARFLGDEAAAHRHFDAALVLDASAGPTLLERTRGWADEPPAHRSEPASVPATPAAATSDTHTPDAEPSDSELSGAGVVDPPARRVEHGCLRWEGELWELEFAGRAARVRDVKGLHDLAVLLARPGAQTHVSELTSAEVVQAELGPLADRRAIAAYRQRLVDLADELAEAEDHNDLARAEHLQLEREALLGELGAVTGLGNRQRRTGSSAERMRKAVTNRIRQAITRVSAVHPELGRHLNAAVRTGTYCSYQPEYPVSWELPDPARSSSQDQLP